MKRKRSILLVKPHSDESDEEIEDKNEKEQQVEEDEEEMESGEVNGVKPLEEKKQKKRKPGIIYISSIPKHMNVALIREYLAPFGDLGRVFLQPDKKFREYFSFKIRPSCVRLSPFRTVTRKKKLHSQKQLAIHFTEGWVEFLSKRKAKFAAQQLNNQPITTKKNSRFCDVLWSLKYLPRFKWVHLSERLTYEKQMYKQKLQAEISQARKEANFFQANLDKSEKVKKINKKKVREEKKLSNKAN